MRALKPGEIRLLCDTLAHLEGARLQSVQSSKKDLILEFWLKGELYYLWYEDSSLRPVVTFWPDALPFKIKKSPLPLLLFLKAHFVGKILEDVIFHAEEGRVLKLCFGEGRVIELRLFPHGQNVLVKTNEKALSLHRPKDLQPLRDLNYDQDLRSVEEFSHEWLQGNTKLDFKVSPSASAPKVPQKPLEKELEKKKTKLKKAIANVEAELERKDFTLYQSAGEWLQNQNTFSSLPAEYALLVDRRRSLRWNINALFERAKELRRKKTGTKERVMILKGQLAELDEKGLSALTKKPQVKNTRIPQTKTLKTRSFQVSEDLRVMAGKSAKDNLNLLRQAKAWDLWFHLKDRPSSHAVVFRPKKRDLSAKEELQIAQWFIQENFGKKWKQEIGNTFDVIVAECRFVKPIKGDKLGRVHYHNEKLLRVRVKDS